ncbi:MAG: glycosyltransferase, partial [Bacteroidota bacterium]
MLALPLICTALILFYALYLWRAAWFFGRIKVECVPNAEDAQPFVSVIVPARNEAANIAACVKAVMAQDYPAARFELIVVNDHSEDATRDLAEEAAGIAGNFRVLDLEKAQGVAYKKAAVAAGIAAAKGEIILTTDADCTMGPGWISAMVAQFRPEVGMVSGPVLLESETTFGHFQALEFMGLIAVGAGAIEAGTPNMCNGANLAYRKAVFEEVGGFAGIDHIASGDDELLMHKIAAETNYIGAFAKCSGAVVRTAAHHIWTAWSALRGRG